ncbi:hypothetical protein D9757_002666 [Collybiopsis confluens]|uniref:RING-type domain-containing protein n=1 Tax=Collybiopsis confluens TaxID=2823264 RepID=A0A8H5MEG6_9AGAR|nr:hypothetical protein D9757_002666 [Collybiopsis confluens]
MAEATSTFTDIVQTISSEDEHDSEAASTHPINTPYITDCQHIYCYHCIAEHMMRNADEIRDEDGWECLRCAQTVYSAERYVIEFAESGGDEASGSDYAFSSDMDFDVTDISESIGSYSESGLSDEY